MKTEKKLENLMKLLESEYKVKGCFILTEEGDELSFFNNENAFHESASRMRVIINGYEELKRGEWVEEHINDLQPNTGKDAKRYIG